MAYCILNPLSDTLLGCICTTLTLICKFVLVMHIAEILITWHCTTINNTNLNLEINMNLKWQLSLVLTILQTICIICFFWSTSIGMEVNFIWNILNILPILFPLCWAVPMTAPSCGNSVQDPFISVTWAQKFPYF